MDINADDWQLIGLGDEAAYEKMYLHFYKKFYVYGLKITPQSNLVEDAIQDAMIYIWQKRESLSGIDNHPAYFFTFFRNRLFQKIREHSILPESEIHPLEDDISASPEQIILDRESEGLEKVQIKRAISQLTSRQSEAISLRFYQRLSYEEIAEIMGITVKGTYKLMARALAELKNYYLPVLFLLSWMLFW